MVSGSAELVFVSVTLWVVLGVPTGWLAKVKLAVDSVTTGAARTLVETVTLLFALLGSGSLAVTVSVVPKEPATVGVKTAFTTAVEPLAIEPSKQLNWVVPWHVP